MNSIYPELIAVDVQAETSEEAIRKVGQIFLDNGFVKDTYIDAVVAREKVYPTIGGYGSGNATHRSTTCI